MFPVNPRIAKIDIHNPATIDPTATLTLGLVLAFPKLHIKTQIYIFIDSPYIMRNEKLTHPVTF